MYRQNFTAQRLIIIYNKVQKNKQFCLHIVSFYKNILLIKIFRRLLQVYCSIALIVCVIYIFKVSSLWLLFRHAERCT